MKKVVVLSLILGFFVVSCSSKSSEENTGPLQYELAIVDSVQVDMFSNGLNISDVDVETGQLLAIQSDPPVAYLLSAEGQVLETMKRPADDPQAVGQYILCGSFFEDGIALMGVMRIKTYDRAFNLRKSMKFPYASSGMIYLGSNHLFEYRSQNDNLLVAYPGGPHTELPSIQEEFYKEFTIVDIVDPNAAGGDDTRLAVEGNAEVFRPIGKLEPGSRYLNGKAYYFLQPIFDVKGDQFIYAFKTDTTLYERELPNGELTAQYKIPFDNFVLVDGNTMGPKGIEEQYEPRDRTGQVKHVYSANEFTVVVYSSGMKLSDIRAIPEGPDKSGQIRKIDYNKYLILKDGERVNANLRLPEKISYFDMADNEGYLWAHQNVNILDEEPDLITFYKLKVVPVE